MSYRDLEELLAERGIEGDHVTLYRWVQRFTPLVIDAAGPRRQVAGDRWFVDETYIKVSGSGPTCTGRSTSTGQVIDVYLSQRRDIASARTFFTAALTVHGVPTEVITDRKETGGMKISDSTKTTMRRLLTRTLHRDDRLPFAS